jgi:hypothetical protein
MLACMETIMSKTGAEPQLRDDELDRVTGGLVVNAIIAVLIPLLLPDSPKKAAECRSRARDQA